MKAHFLKFRGVGFRNTTSSSEIQLRFQNPARGSTKNLHTTFLAWFWNQIPGSRTKPPRQYHLQIPQIGKIASSI